MLVTFLTGPFSALTIVIFSLRAAALAIGLRRGWRVGRTLLVGTTFIWLIACLGITLVALALPAWRSATEQGLALTLRQLAGLLHLLLGLLGQGQLWQQVQPRVDAFISWFVAHWLLMLPLIAWPLLYAAMVAEYVIAEAILPRFGFTPPPFRLAWRGGGSKRGGSHHGGLPAGVRLAPGRRGHRAEGDGAAPIGRPLPVEETVRE
jgi:hypothetical protein